MFREGRTYGPSPFASLPSWPGSGRFHAAGENRAFMGKFAEAIDGVIAPDAAAIDATERQPPVEVVPGPIVHGHAAGTGLLEHVLDERLVVREDA